MSYLNQNFLNCDNCIAALNKSDIFKSAIEKANKYIEKLELPESLQICAQNGDIPELINICDNLKNRNVVILGIGGSSLGGQAVHEFATKYNKPITISQKQKPSKDEDFSFKNTNLYFFDNIDIDYFDKILDIENPFVIVISKSGETTETLMQFEFIIDIIKSKNFLIITEDKDSSLIRIAKCYKIPVLEHNKNIGGRFSIFSNVGLIPAILSDVDPFIFRENAAKSFEELKSDIAKAAAINYTLQNSGFNISPMMIYSDRLQKFGDWFTQLWSESLGKNGYGSTPITMLGTTFQHSILQLFLSGPNDKYFTVISENKQTQSSKNLLGDVIGSIMALNDESSTVSNFFDKTDSRDFANISPTLSYLKDKSMDEVFKAERDAVIKALIESGKPVRHISLSFENIENVGMLFSYFMLETIVTAELFGIDPFTQDSVEKVKILTKQLLGEK